MRPEFAAEPVFASPSALAHEITIGAAVRSVLWAALPPARSAPRGTWDSERAVARERLRHVLAQAGARPVGLELVDRCATASGDDVDFGSDTDFDSNTDSGSETGIDVADIEAAAAADVADDTSDGETRRWIAAVAINGLASAAAADAAAAAVTVSVGGGVPPAVSTAIATAIHNADAVDAADDAALRAAGCLSGCSGCEACLEDITRADCTRAMAAARDRLTVSDIVLGAPDAERLAAAAFIATDETAAAAALELVRRVDAPAGLALAAVYHVVLCGMLSPATFGDFTVVASRLASRLIRED